MELIYSVCWLNPHKNITAYILCEKLLILGSECMRIFSLKRLDVNLHHWY